MLYLVFLLILLTSFESQVSTTSKNTNLDFGKGLIKSFLQFKDKVKSFLLIKFNKIERIKKAFKMFIKEAFGNGTNSATTAKYVQMDDDWIVTTIVSENVSEQVTAEEFKSELHTVLTSDGYVLTVQRILPATKESNKKIVLLHHGLLGSSDDWLLLGPDRCLPSLLSRMGYDVWLANARGNRYSKVHMNKSTTTQDFWDFSWHEIGLYDLPATIQYIKEYTKDDLEMHFIGHSMGASALLVLLSILPDYNEILSSAILLAPLAFMDNVKGLLRILANAYNKNDLTYLNMFDKDEFMSAGAFPQKVIEKFCKGNERTCSNPLLLLVNGGEEISDVSHMENILNHVPAGGSTKTIIHYGQLVMSRHFQMFDYGLENNLAKYGDYNPPTYNLEKVKIPVVIFNSRDDWLSTHQDIRTLINHLPTVAVHNTIRRFGFGHNDFVWALDAPELIFPQILEIYKVFNVTSSSYKSTKSPTAN